MGFLRRWAGRCAALAVAILPVAACESYDARSTLQVHFLATPAKGVDSVDLRVVEVQVHLASEASGTGDSEAKGSDSGSGSGDAWHALAVNRTLELGSAQAPTHDLGQLRLDEGWIDQLRVTLASPTTASAGGKTCTLVVGQLPKDGIKISSPFRPFAVYHAVEHAIWLNLRLDQALTKSGDCWSLGPVLEVKRFTTGGKDVAVQ